MVVAVFMSWFDTRKEGQWLKEIDLGYGYTALHVALMYKAPEAVAMALFEAWPDAVKETDCFGKTPLQYALEFNAPEAVVLALFAAWPDLAKEDYEGEPPLHLALRNNAPAAVVVAMVAAYPEGVKEIDRKGYTPPCT